SAHHKDALDCAYRVFRDREDFLAHDDDWLMSRFRFPRAILLELCSELRPVLERPSRRNHVLCVPVQVLTTLGHLATGTFQRELADRSGMLQSSLSRVMPYVWDAIVGMAPRYICFPYTQAEQANIKMQFAAIAGFPNVIGAIDCTHVAIKAPSENEFAFVNRKHFHSLNVQIICDAHISVGNRLQTGAVRDGWLLGDSGYPLRTWLLTPLTRPQTEQERRYNEKVVERTIGLLKGRWRCLDRSGGTVLYSPTKVWRIVVACAVLHNIAQKNGIPVPSNAHTEDNEPDPGPPNAVHNAMAIQRRINVINGMLKGK
uniref:Putative nuclease HARBI1 n=1 Tax=Cyprinus carpio carpio TaxID=630221 RepID=A0A9J7Z0A2_CYPCA